MSTIQLRNSASLDTSIPMSRMNMTMGRGSEIACTKSHRPSSAIDSMSCAVKARIAGSIAFTRSGANARISGSRYGPCSGASSVRGISRGSSSAGIGGTVMALLEKRSGERAAWNISS